MLEKHLKAKIADFKLDLQAKRKEIRQFRQRLKEVTESRDNWKAKYKVLEAKLAVYERDCHVISEVEIERLDTPIGHKYDAQMVSLCVQLYAFAGCSFRSVRLVLVYLQLAYRVFSSDIPSKSSIENWVQKLGYYEYTHYGSDLYESDYALIIDESMVVGQQRMMVVLGVNALKKTEIALDLGCVRLLYLAVKPSWKAEDVVDLLKKVVEKMGKPPLYVISDASSNLKRGIQDADLERVCDVGHQIAKLVELTYTKDERFKAFTTAVAGVKFREVMKDTAYLLPPKQRTIARFMNLSDIVVWATKLLKVLPTLTEIEQETFNWLKDFKSLIEELYNVFEMTHQMLKIIKNKGLSYAHISQCLNLVLRYGTKIPIKLADKTKVYFNVEKAKLPDSTTIWHASSDVIESLFGKFKQRAAPNKLHGVTPLVLSLCVHTHFSGNEGAINDQIKFALQNVSMADLARWKRKHLIENQVVRRKNIFKK